MNQSNEKIKEENIRRLDLHEATKREMHGGTFGTACSMRSKEIPRCLFKLCDDLSTCN